MSSLNWNVLFFIWLGAFVFVNLFTAGVIISKGKQKLPIPNCSGALIIFGFVLSGTLALSLGGKFAVPSFVSSPELIFILSSAFVLMLVYYFSPQTILWDRLRKGLVSALIITSFFLLNPSAFVSYSLPFWLLCIIAGGLWLWFISAFKMMDKVDGLTISEGSLICFGIAFSCFLNPKIPTEIAITAVCLGVCLLGFRSWNRFPAKMKLHPSAVIPTAFVIGWFLMKSASLGFWTLALILPLYYFLETLYAYLKRPFKPFKDEAIPYALKLSAEGISQKDLVSFIFRRNLILLAAALVSTGTSFGLSFFCLAFFLTAYELYLLKNWGVKEPSIRELSKDFATTMKEGWKEQKLIFSALLNGKKIAPPQVKEAEKEKEEEQKPKMKTAKRKATATKKKTAGKKSPTKTATKKTTKKQAKK